jgi:hypothetical protein
MEKAAAIATMLWLATLASLGQTDTNVIDARKLTRFWTAIQGTNAVRVGAFGDSVTVPDDGGKMAGFGPQLSNLLGNPSGGVTANFPYLYFQTNGVGVYRGPDTNWWWYHYEMTNGSTSTYLAAITNGPAENSTSVWCDTIAVYYLTGRAAGTFTISVSTNGGPFGIVGVVSALGTYGGAVTNLNLPLDYYQLRIACTAGSVTLIDCGMWNEHQRNLTYVFASAPGMAYIDWTAVSTNVTWPIFEAWNPTLLLLEAKDTPDWFRASFPLLEQMFTNCAPGMDALYLGTTPQGTNVNPTINEQFALPQNAIMSELATTYGRPFWNSYYIVTYEQATALGWTRNDGTHFNFNGGAALGDMLWSDVWAGFHRTEAGIANGALHLSWYTLKGRTYQVQWAADVSAPNWQNLGDPLLATNATTSIADPLGPGRRFYRLLLVP